MITIDEKGKLTDELVSCRYKNEFTMSTPDRINYMDVSPRQIVSVAASLIPFLEHDDANRALMGSNMQRQSVPLMKPTAPLVGTGLEKVVAKDSRTCIVAPENGEVVWVDAEKIILKTEEVPDALRLVEGDNLCILYTSDAADE